MSGSSKLKFSQTVKAPASAVYYAFTNQAAITQWLCNNAQVNVQKGGALFFNWNRPKYFAVGEYTSVRPEKRLTFTWQGRGEPGPTTVNIKFKEENGSTHISLVHKNVGKGSEWERTRAQIKRGWGNGLDNLKQVLEAGLDKRIYDQPFLGVLIAGLVSTSEAEDEGFEAKGGIRISGALPGTGAEAAGLKDQDIIVTLSGIDTDSLPKMQQVLREHTVGDTFQVTYYRNGQTRTSDMTLSNRPRPEVPDSPAELSEAVAKSYSKLNDELSEIVADLPEAAADFTMPGDRWNAKQIMGHLLTNERSLQMWIASMVDNQYLSGWPNNPQSWIKAVAESATMGELVEAFKHSEMETVSLLANLPEDTVNRRATYIQIGFNVLVFFPSHTQGHLNDLRQAIAIAQQEAG